MSGDNSTIVSASEKATEAKASDVVQPNDLTTPEPEADTEVSTKSQQTAENVVVSSHETEQESESAQKAKPPVKRVIIKKKIKVQRKDDTKQENNAAVVGIEKGNPTSVSVTTPKSASKTTDQSTVIAAGETATSEPTRRKRTVFGALLRRYGVTHELYDDSNDVEKGTDDNDFDNDSDEDRDQEKDDYSQAHGNSDSNNGLDNRSTRHHESSMDFNEKALDSALQSKSKSSIKLPSNRARAAADEPTIKKEPLVGVREVSPDGASQDSSISKAWTNLPEYFVKFINVATSLFFFAHGIMHIVTIGQIVGSPLGAITESIHSAVITMWSLSFAAIAGQALRAYATWKAERGIKLMSLEQLLHSQSFSSSIKQPLLLRQIDCYSLALFFLWALSPLTNQAIQKMPTQVSTNQSTTVDVTYLARTSSDGSRGGQLFEVSLFEPLYGSALLAESTSQDIDLDGWKNPKIPLLAENFSDFDSKGNFSHDWIYPDGSWDDYISLIGIPVSHYALGNVSSIVINTSYFNFDCQKPEVVTLANFASTSSNSTNNFSPSFMTESATLRMAYNSISNASNTGPASGIMEWASVLNVKSLTQTDCPEDDVNCIPDFYAKDDTEFAYSTCFVKPVGLQVSIDCIYDVKDELTCGIKSARIVPDAPFAYLPLMSDMLESFTRAQSGTPGISTTTISEAYMANSDYMTQYLTGKKAPGPTILDLGKDEFTRSMLVMWNTFYALYYGSEAYTQGVWNSSGMPNISSTTGDFISDNQLYALDPVWTAIYFFSCAVLLALAIADIIWEAKTISPDFLGFASSVVRNNQRLNKQFRTSNLSGLQKTRAMANMEVMIQDVNSAGNVGKIALAPSVASSVRLRRTRDYGA